MTNECILIYCATEIEAKAINSVFTSEDEFNRDVSGEVTYYNLGNMGDVDIKLVLSEQGSVTPDGSLSTLSIAIPELNPKAIILCGYGFGLKPKEKNLGDQEICDIMISEKIVNYEPQKININSGEIPRGDRVAASPILKDHFRSASLDWKTPHIHFGLILTGEKLVNDPEFLSFLLSHEPEAIGGEMEAAGYILHVVNSIKNG